MPYISKARAQQLVGTGLSAAKLEKLTKKVAAAAKSAVDTNRNQQIDGWELRKAAKDSRLNKAQTDVLFSAYGTEFMLSDPDGRANRVANGKNLAATVTAYGRSLKNLATGSKITAESLQGKTLSNLEIKLLEEARKSR